MTGEVPEKDECGKKIKKRKVGLKDTGTQLLDFRDNWVGEERVEMRQKSNSEDETEIEEENTNLKCIDGE